MFAQIVSFSGTVYEETQAYIQKFAKKNAQKISAFLMASKMLSVIVLLSLVPIDAVKTPTRPQYQSAIKFDATNPLAITAKDRQVVASSGESNFDAQERSKAESAQSVVYSSTPSRGVERDPSYFRGLYERAASAYGVPWQLLEAVHYVETGASDSTSEASYAGARGPMQFMPGTWRTYGVDGNGDGRADITNVEDAVFGAANLLASSGAAEGNIDGALFNYNHAQWYVNKVKQIAQDAGM